MEDLKKILSNKEKKGRMPVLEDLEASSEDEQAYPEDSGSGVDWNTPNFLSNGEESFVVKAQQIVTKLSVLNKLDIAKCISFYGFNMHYAVQVHVKRLLGITSATQTKAALRLGPN